MGLSSNLLIIKAGFGGSCKMLLLGKAISDLLPETDSKGLVATLPFVRLGEVLPNVQCISKPKGSLRLPFQKANAFVLARQ